MNDKRADKKDPKAPRGGGVLARAARKEALQKDSRVKAEHLTQLAVIRGILSALNDSHIGADQIARMVEAMSPLRARLALQFLGRFPDGDLPVVGEQIARLGNRELEAVLLALLEDLTILHSELGETP